MCIVYGVKVCSACVCQNFQMRCQSSCREQQSIKLFNDVFISHRHNYCCVWEVTLSLSHTLIVIVFTFFLALGWHNLYASVVVSLLLAKSEWAPKQLILSAALVSSLTEPQVGKLSSVFSTSFIWLPHCASVNKSAEAVRFPVVRPLSGR